MNPNLTELCRQIVETHHKYVNQAMPEILILTEKLISTHKENEELERAQKLIIRIFSAIKNHLIREETGAFIIIKYLERCKKFKERPRSKNYKTVQKVVSVLSDEHTSSERDLQEFNQILNKVKLEYSKDQLFNNLVKQMDFFKQDLKKHIYLEDNILFPRAVELENKLKEGMFE